MTSSRRQGRGGRARPSARPRVRAASAIRAEDYPHVEAFCRGYLHEDFVHEHGSAGAAFEAFLGDLAATDREALAQEGARLGVAIDGLSLDALRTVWGTVFRAAWHPADARDVLALVERIRSAADS